MYVGMYVCIFMCVCGFSGVRVSWLGWSVPMGPKTSLRVCMYSGLGLDMLIRTHIGCNIEGRCMYVCMFVCMYVYDSDNFLIEQRMYVYVYMFLLYVCTHLISHKRLPSSFCRLQSLAMCLPRSACQRLPTTQRHGTSAFGLWVVRQVMPQETISIVAK